MSDRRKILININAKVRVKLSPVGLKTLEGKREEIQMHMRRNVIDLWPADPEGYHTFPLWEFMNLFGHLYIMGSAHMPTVNNRMVFTEGGADNEVMIEPEFPGKPPEKSCETCGHKPAFGSPTPLAVHCLICKDGCSQWEKIVVADQKKSMCDWHHDSINRLGLLFDELGRKVKALEDRHREIPKVISICPKPCYCKFPGQLPVVCYNTCAGTHCVYHKEHKG